MTLRTDTSPEEQAEQLGQETAVVTGAFGYLGSYIAEKLLAQGIRVRTLTGHPQRQHALQGRVEAVPFHFDDPARLVEDLRGARVVYNTYWVRFDHGDISHAAAVANTQNLMRAAQQARAYIRLGDG